MRSSLLKKFHQIFLFPGRNEKDYKDPDKDPTMKKINKHAMTKFSDVGRLEKSSESKDRRQEGTLLRDCKG